MLIVGAGNQGALADAPGSGNEHKIISFAHAFKEHPGFEIIGIADTDEKKSKYAESLWREPDSIGKGCSKIKPDIVVIATPDDTHCELLKYFVEQPLKLVICEKPLCTDLQQAREIVELYKSKGIPLMCNYTRRFLPHYDRLKKHGKPTYAKCIFNRGWLHTATHAIDFFNMIDCDNYYIEKFPFEDVRVWDINVFYDNYVFSEKRYGNDPVWNYCDKQTWYVADNAYNFLEGREQLKCTGEDGLRALEICYELMEGAKII